MRAICKITKQFGMLVLLYLCAGISTGHSVILATGDGTGNTTSTGAGAGWDYVGTVNGASGVYLGEYGGQYWVLTAAHVGAGSFTLNGTTYNMVVNSAIRVENSNGSDTDLVLFAINGDPGLVQLDILDQQAAMDSSVAMIGYGRNRASSLTKWNVTDNGAGGFNWTETTHPFNYNASGYKWAAGNTKRWGTNTIDGSVSFDIGYGQVSGYTVDFDANVTNQAQAAVGDSGGGVFYYNTSTSQWSLSGIMLVVTEFTDQPDETSVFGNQTYIADITAYRDFILQAIPEPSTYYLLLLTIGFSVAWARRRRFLR